MGKCNIVQNAGSEDCLADIVVGMSWIVNSPVVEINRRWWVPDCAYTKSEKLQIT